MLKWILIGLGGGVGAVLRFALQGAMQPKGSLFPWGTWAVNVTGCLAIGFLMALLTGPYVIRPEYRLGIVTGVLGGYTTFSSFSWEAMQLVEQRQWGLALLYVGSSAIVGLVATFAGIRLSQWMYGV
jgi:fluoride exporter